MSSTRKRLAAAFVVTSALGCQDQTRTNNPPPPDPPPTATSVVVETPPPEPTAEATIATAPTASEEAPPPRLEPGRIVMQDGQCHFHVNVACPEGAPCNPPAPRHITCPAGVEPAELPQITNRRSDGVCIRFEHAPPPKCPPNVRCNPPPPKRIEIPCPDA